MVFHTLSGSVYELDRAGEKVRRLEGKKNPTPRQGPDGEWKKFSSCSEVRVGHPVLIQWGPGTKSTFTSEVVMVNPYAVISGRN